jgi:hypothetical protein
MPQRRELTFGHLSQVMPEVDRLLQGYRLGGQWTLGQVCQHLTRSLQGSVEGIPGAGAWLLRRTIGPWLGRRMLSRGIMPAGFRIRPEWGVMPGTGLDDRAEAEALRGAILYYSGRTEGFPEHPMFGRLGREQWDRLHCIHCAHHLGFLLPEGPDAGQAGRGGSPD